jgi:hypothetical protein
LRGSEFSLGDFGAKFLPLLKLIGDKVAGAELPEQNPALLDSIQLSTPQSRLIGLTMRVPPGAFRILRVIFEPGGR